MQAFVEADFAFHKAVVEATHNSLLIDCTTTSPRRVYDSIAHMVDEETPETATEEARLRPPAAGRGYPGG